jgi:hypothetical protein
VVKVTTHSVGLPDVPEISTYNQLPVLNTLNPFIVPAISALETVTSVDIIFVPADLKSDLLSILNVTVVFAETVYPLQDKTLPGEGIRGPNTPPVAGAEITQVTVFIATTDNF